MAFTPNSDGGSPITAFHAQCVSTDGGVTNAKQGSTSPLNVTGLTASQELPLPRPSPQLHRLEPLQRLRHHRRCSRTTAPAAPTLTSTTPSSTGLSVAFTPNSDGGSPITAFYAQCVSTDGGVTSGKQGSTSPLNVTGLTAGKSYRCRVQARNSVGWSPYSGYGTTVTAPTTEPAAPTVNSTTPSSNGLSVAFTPNSDGGSPITAFHAQCVSTNGGVTSAKQGSTSPLNVTGLTATKSYRCRVQARNTIGWSPYSGYGTTETAP